MIPRLFLLQQHSILFFSEKNSESIVQFDYRDSKPLDPDWVRKKIVLAQISASKNSTIFDDSIDKVTSNPFGETATVEKYGTLEPPKELMDPMKVFSTDSANFVTLDKHDKTKTLSGINLQNNQSMTLTSGLSPRETSQLSTGTSRSAHIVQSEINLAVQQAHEDSYGPEVYDPVTGEVGGFVSHDPVKHGDWISTSGRCSDF